jgi:hypothetical protein
MVLLLFALFRASFEPLSWRRDYGPSIRIEGRSIFLGGITTTTHAAAQNRRGLAWQRNRTLGAPSFSPYRSRVPAPFRRFAPSAFPLVHGAPGVPGVLSLDRNRPRLNRIESSAPKASDKFSLETTLRSRPSIRTFPPFKSKAREKHGKISST